MDEEGHTEIIASGGERRGFLKKSVMGACGLALGGYACHRLLGPSRPPFTVGFPGDAPEVLDQWSRPAEWAEAHLGLITCKLCPHQCVLGENDRGFCRVRAVKNGALHTLVYGNACSANLDPMEKKPLYHFLPGRPILSIATAGCNLRCRNCQNWQISQAKPDEIPHGDLPPERVVEIATARRIPAIAYTYSEPIIYYEYARDTCALAREKGIRNVLVTAGYINPKPLRELCKVADAANVDLKSFDDRTYRTLNGARLAPILRTLEIMREEGVWVEIARLVVPHYADDLDDIKRMCAWIVEALGPDVPLHFSRFHGAYQLERLAPTPVATLDAAEKIARECGIHHVYVGNVPGRASQTTRCPACERVVVERIGYRVTANRLGADGKCECGAVVAGVWG